MISCNVVTLRVIMCAGMELNGVILAFQYNGDVSLENWKEFQFSGVVHLAREKGLKGTGIKLIDVMSKVMKEVTSR